MQKLKKGILSFLVVSFTLAFTIPFQALYSQASAGGVIVIDPGHDAGDPGAIAPDGTQERYLNAQLAYKLAKHLQGRGYDVTFSHTISYAKDVPQDVPYILEYQPTKYDILGQLVPAIQSKNPDMAISIHQNTATSTTANGFEAYWRSDGTPVENHQKSEDLGTFTTNQCCNLSYIKPRPNPVQDSMFMICKSTVPTILFEAGFMSNPSELANLKDSAKQNQMANCIANGIDDYFNKYPSTHVDIPATYESAQIIQDPKNDGIFTAVVYNVQSAHGIKTVQFPHWAPGAADPVWVDGYSIGNNAWAYTFDARNKPGNWSIHFYAVDNYGYLTGLTSLTATVTNAVSGENVLISSKNDRQDTFTIIAQNLTNANQISSVKFPTFAPEPGDAKWFEGAKLAANTWAVTLRISDFDNTPGTYTTHVYKQSSSSPLELVGAAPPVQIDGFSYDSVEATPYDPSSETFTVNINNLRSPANVTEVQVAIWSDPSNLVWYNASKVQDNTYQITVDINNHKRLSGTYYIDTYAKDGRGMYSFITGTNIQITVPSTNVTITGDATESNFTITATGVPSRATGVSFPVWNKDAADSKVIRYTGSKVNSTTWEAVFPISDYQLTGNYYCDTYAQINGASTFLNSTTFYVTPPSVQNLSAVDNGNNTFDVTLQGVTSPALPIQEVTVAVWKAADDLVWYHPTNVGNDTWKFTGNLADHKFRSGTYFVDAYVRDSRNINKFVGEIKPTFTYQNTTSVTIQPDSTQSNYTITATGVPAESTAVSFPVWNRDTAGSKVIWYSGAKLNETTWRAVVPISDHGLSGNYYCDTYATIFGNSVFLKSSDFHVDPPTAAQLSMDLTTNVITLTGASSPASVTDVKFPAWHSADQSDIYWYPAQNQGNGTWTATFNPAYHQGHSGTYYIHAYVFDSRGIATLVKEITVENISGSSSIMGPSSSNKEQMTRYFASSGSSYPYASDPNNSGASDITGFAQIYLEEGAAEGVRGDIAFCQAMKETGWLRFTGDVKLNQYNFCGLGATGGGNPGHSFANVREGIRAHIQHLKAYGSTDPLNQACVDPRFSYVTRGCAPAFEDLGGRWAPSSTYGIEIVNMFKKMMTL